MWVSGVDAVGVFGCVSHGNTVLNQVRVGARRSDIVGTVITPKSTFCSQACGVCKVDGNRDRTALRAKRGACVSDGAH